LIKSKDADLIAATRTSAQTMKLHTGRVEKRSFLTRPHRVAVPKATSLWLLGVRSTPKEKRGVSVLVVPSKLYYFNSHGTKSRRITTASAKLFGVSRKHMIIPNVEELIAPDHSYFGNFRVRIGTYQLSNVFKKTASSLKQEGLIREFYTFVDASDPLK